MSKKLFLLPILLFGAFLFTTTTSCGDKCKDADCVNGVCLDNSCECDLGYEYDDKGNCTVEVREKILGNFTVSETDPNCSNDPTPYVVTFDRGAAADEVTISNFYGSGAGSLIHATVGNDARITIHSQALGADFTTDGSGDINSVGGVVQLSMTYKIYQAGVEVASCSNVVWTR